MNIAPTTLKTVHRTMLIGFIGVLILLFGAIGAGWYYILQMSNTVNKYNAEINTVRAQTEKLAELSWRYQRVLPKKSLVMGTIPNVKDESTFMADMEALAAKDGIKITGNSIGASQKGTKVGDLSQTVNKDDYYELPIKYEVTGMYVDLVKYINELPTLRRLSSVNDLAVTANLSDKTVQGKVNATFIVTIYVKK